MVFIEEALLMLENFLRSRSWCFFEGSLFFLTNFSRFRPECFLTFDRVFFKIDSSLLNIEVTLSIMIEVTLPLFIKNQNFFRRPLFQSRSFTLFKISPPQPLPLLIKLKIKKTVTFKSTSRKNLKEVITSTFLLSSKKSK